MIRRPPRSTRTDTLFPYTTLFRARQPQKCFAGAVAQHLGHTKASGVPGHRLENVLAVPARSEEHTSELQSLMRNSYAVFCLKKKQQNLGERTSATSDKCR